MNNGILLFAFGISCWACDWAMHYACAKWKRLPNWVGNLLMVLAAAPCLLLMFMSNIHKEETWRESFGYVGIGLFVWHYFHNMNRPKSQA